MQGAGYLEEFIRDLGLDTEEGVLVGPRYMRSLPLGFCLSIGSCCRGAPALTVARVPGDGFPLLCVPARHLCLFLRSFSLDERTCARTFAGGSC